MLGKIMRISCAATGQQLTNLAKECTAELNVSAVNLNSAVWIHGTRKVQQKKSWTITGELLFTPSEFLRLYQYILGKQKLTVDFADYQGAAYVASLSLSANVKNLVRCRVTLQGTGALLDVS